jgi:RNA polymerase sigma-70 factor (ECF subfamily)
LPALVRHSAAPASNAARPFSSLSDEELLVDLKKGSEAHFSELYERYFHRIYTFSYARVRNHADAEEIAQETFMAVFSSVDAYRGQASLLSWIYGIAKNTANNQLRRRKTLEQRLDAVEPELVAPSMSFAHADPGEQLDMKLYTDALEMKLSALADWQIEIFCMRHLENMSIPDICDRTDRSSDAVRSSLYRVKRIFVETAEGAPAQ